MKVPRVLSLKTADAPRLGVVAYGTVQSRSRPGRVNHTVTKQGHNWMCSCEHFLFRRTACAHIKRARLTLARRRAA
jgi:hypothetical protein